MSITFGPAWLLLIPFLAILSFEVWALWNFSQELRAGRRHRIRRSIAGHPVPSYEHGPRRPVPRFSRGRNDEAA